MCTIIRSNERLIADTDIKCVKMLQIMEDENGNPVYVTPYYFKHVPEAILKGEVPFVAEGDDILSYNAYGNTYQVNGGFIHVYPHDVKKEFFLNDLADLCSAVGETDCYFTNKMADENNRNQIPGVDPYAIVKGIALFEAIIPKGTEYMIGFDGNGYDCSNVIYTAKQIVFTGEPVIIDIDNCDEDFDCPKYDKIFGKIAKLKK